MNQTGCPSENYPTWVRDHAAAVYQAAFRILREQGAAEDVTQQVFLAALEGRLDVDAAAGLEQRLRWRAIKTALFHLRSERRRRAREERVAMQRGERTMESRTVDDRESQQRVMQLVDALPEELRLPVMLRFEQSLSFRRIGELCAIAEATAFERVQKGMERLKRELERIGLVALVPSLPKLLESLPQAIPVPPGLETGLAGLLAPSAASSASLVATALGSKFGLVGIALLAVIALYWSMEALSTVEPVPPATPRSTHIAQSLGNESAGGEIRREPSAGSNAPVAADAEELRSASKQSGAMAFATASVQGRFVDSRGQALDGLEVRWQSVERKGKEVRFERVVQTDRDGFFEVELPVAQTPQQYYTWSAQRSGLEAEDGTKSIALAPAARVDLGSVVFGLSEGDVLGETDIVVHARDEQGRPLAKAIVELWSPGKRRATDVVYTDAAGHARFREHSRGLRRVFVTAAQKGLAAREVDFDSRVEVAPIEVELRRGKRLEGRLLCSTGAAPTGVHVALKRGERWLNDYPNLGEDGRFAFTSLDEGDYRLVVNGGSDWSDVTLDPVRADGSELLIELKPLGETRSLGMHDAEIHGLVVDAESGAELVAVEHDIELHRIGERTREAALAQDALQWLTPFFGQTAQFDFAPRAASARFVIDGCEAGRYLLVARRSGFAPLFMGPIELGPKQICADLRIELARGVQISGHVLDVEGKALAEALVFVAPESEAAQAEVLRRDQLVRERGGKGFLEFGPYERSDPAGSFELKHQAPEVCARIWVLHPAYQPQSWPLQGSTHGMSSTALELRLTNPSIK